MRRLAAAFTTLGVAVAAILIAAGPADAMAKIHCKTISGTANVDPILAHDQSGPTAHNHTFFGNAHLLTLKDPNAANYTDMVGQATNCANPNDTAGYWVPTLYQNGKPVPVRAFTAYYRAFNHKEFGPGQAIAPDTRLISMPTSKTSLNNWSCGQFSNVQPSSTFPDCSGQSGKAGNTLTAHVTFPSCWDGVKPNHTASQVGDTADTAHYAYTVKGQCPKGFPIQVTELRETISYAYTGNGKDLTLASDMMMGGHNGSTLHGDYWQTWNQTGFEQMIRDCITGPKLHPAFSGECS